MQWINTLLEPVAGSTAASTVPRPVQQDPPGHNTKRPSKRGLTKKKKAIPHRSTSTSPTTEHVDHLYSRPPDDATTQRTAASSSNNPLLYCRQAAATVLDTDQMTELWTTPQKVSQRITASCQQFPINATTPTTAASSSPDLDDVDTYRATKEEIYLQQQQADPGAQCGWCKPEDIISRPQEEYHVPPEKLKQQRHNLQHQQAAVPRMSPISNIPSDEDHTTLKHTNVQAPSREEPPGLTKEPTRSWLLPWNDEIVPEEKKEEEDGPPRNANNNNNNNNNDSLAQDPIKFLTRTISAMSKQSLNISITNNTNGSQQNTNGEDNKEPNDIHTSLQIIPANEPIEGLPTEVTIYRPRLPWQNANGSDPVMQITWFVDCHRERGLVDKWTGSLLRDEVEIGFITVYAISARIMDQALINDRVVQEFVDEFLLPVLVLDNRQSRQRTSQNVTQDLSLAQELAAGPLYLVSDITIQPKHRGTGLGLYLLDAACRQVANNHSIGDDKKKNKHGGGVASSLAINEACISGTGPVIVSMREAIDRTLAVYFGLLGFTQGLRDHYVIRRRPRPDQKLPYPIVEDVCPHIPTQAPRGAKPPADKRASF